MRSSFVRPRVQPRAPRRFEPSSGARLTNWQDEGVHPLCLVHYPEKAGELTDVPQPFPLFAREAYLVVAAQLSFDNPPLQCGQLPEGDEVAVCLAHSPHLKASSFRAGYRVLFAGRWLLRT